MKMGLKTRKSNFHRADTRCKVLQGSVLIAAVEPSTVPASPMILHTAYRSGSGESSLLKKAIWDRNRERTQTAFQDICFISISFFKIQHPISENYFILLKKGELI